MVVDIAVLARPWVGGVRGQSFGAGAKGPQFGHHPVDDISQAGVRTRKVLNRTAGQWCSDKRRTYGGWVLFSPSRWCPVRERGPPLMLPHDRRVSEASLATRLAKPLLTFA